MASSSSGFVGAPGSDHILVDRADIGLRSSSGSRRNSSLIPSRAGSVAGLSPASFGKGSQVLGEDYMFDGKR